MHHFVYHMVPTEMIGEKLIPLNSLGKVHPSLYEKYTEKYYDHPERSALLKKQVPKLDCLRNDILGEWLIHLYISTNLADISVKYQHCFVKI